MLRNAEPAPAPGCGQPACSRSRAVYRIHDAHNTIWTPEGASCSAFRTTAGDSSRSTDNVDLAALDEHRPVEHRLHDTRRATREAGPAAPGRRRAQVTRDATARRPSRSGARRLPPPRRARRDVGAGRSALRAGRRSAPPTNAAATDTTPPETSITTARAIDDGDERDVRVHRDAGRLDVRVQARRRRLRRVHEPEGLQRPGRRSAHVQRARHRPGGQHRRHARHADVDDHAAPRTRRPPTPRSPRARTRRRSRRAPSFAFTASDAGATFECKLDASSFATCSSPKGYSGLTTGAHTFSVRASDAAGNADATPATQTWTIAPDEEPGEPPPPADAPPTVALNAPASGADPRADAAAHADRGDDRGIDHVEFWLDDALLDRDDSPPFRTQIDRDRLDDWTHTISLRVFDSAGQAVSTALRLRVVRYGGTSEVRRGAALSSAPFGDGVTRLQGQTTPRSGVVVSLTPCASQAARSSTASACAPTTRDSWTWCTRREGCACSSSSACSR